MEVCPDDGARLIETGISDEDPLVGSIFDGRFEIQKKLGEGGMGAVYMARRLDFETDVALKLLKMDFARDDGIRKRFMYEARVISNLRHPHAVRLYDFGQTAEGHVYMVMELLEGESLADRLSYRFVTYREVFDIIPPICGVLGEAHSRDVIHRDLKPENIYLLEVEENREFPKLLDFGIAKHNRAETMTKSGTLWGTPAYMSPEQARGDSVGAPADIYGIGIMLFELISGNLPFHASTQMGYAVRHIHEQVRPLSSIPGLESVPEELDQFIGAMLAKDPSERPESMEVVATTLARIRDDYFDDELLDSVPAQEVDPIGLQGWINEAPEVSQEMPAAKGNGKELTPEQLAATAVAQGGLANVDIDPALRETSVFSANERDELDGAPRDFVETAALGKPAASSQEEERLGGDSAVELSDNEWAVDKRLVVGALVIFIVAGLGGVSLMLMTDDDDESEELAVAVETDEQDAQDRESPDPPGEEIADTVDSSGVAVSATAQALSVMIRAYEVVRDIEPDGLDEDFEEELDFLYGGTGEGGGGGSADDEARVREALERTF